MNTQPCEIKLPIDSAASLSFYLDSSIGIADLPGELIEQILLYVPIDNNLSNVGISYSGFAAFIFNSYYFSSAHYKSYGNGAALFTRDVWITLPLNYHIAILSQLFQTPLMNHVRMSQVLNLKMSMERSVKVFRALERLPGSYNFRACCERSLRWSCFWGYEQVVACLLKQSQVNPAAKFNASLRHAAEFGYLGILNMLLEHTAVDPGDCLNYSLRMAAENGHIEIVKRLLSDDRVDPSAKRNEAVILAAANGFTDIVELLMQDPRVDPSDCDNEAILTACQENHPETVKALLSDPRVDPSEFDNIAFNMAVENEMLEIVSILMKDPRVNPGVMNSTPLLVASRLGSAKMVTLLLSDKRVDPSAWNGQAILNAIFEGHLDVVKVLAKHEKSTNHISAMKMAQRKGFHEIVEFLYDFVPTVTPYEFQ
ncbi:ankyrin [Rhizoclosmatium globosum]|uniref:Ankyrin n=1 Tax=Rhizoclosmatium globosum TaxID=329046 RepID=A0A1Y2CDT3_9FUNG|nr:ankyrin [Rhizoclosmatium globosum]|eukprot:ORY45047.1 ankyrin [Rhizoclosmatium globosum]